MPAVACELAGDPARTRGKRSGARAELIERRADPIDEPQEKLRVVIDRRHHPIDDRREVVEADLQQRVRLDTFDPEVDAAELGVDADVELQKVEDLGLECDARLQRVELEIDLVDLERRDVEEDVRILALRERRAGLPAEPARDVAATLGNAPWRLGSALSSSFAPAPGSPA